jgi:cytochrome c-type biogenesis protein CcmH/NrfG
MTWAASARFEQGDLAGAAEDYRAILQVFPADPVATAMLEACAASIDQTKVAPNSPSVVPAEGGDP